MIEVGFTQAELNYFGEFSSQCLSPIRFISLGRLVNWKGFHLAVIAFAQANIENSEYLIVGNGAQRKRLEKIAKDLGVLGKVRFLGWMSRAEALKQLENSHVLVHPSMRDSGGWACMEAMAAGKPVICLDTGGPAFQVTNNTGIKIPVNSLEQVINDIASAMKKFGSNTGDIYLMGKIAREHIQSEFTWEVRGRLMASYIEETVSRNTRS